MHELSVVEELVAKCSLLAQGRPVLRVWARCPSAMGTDELEECFAYVVGQLGQTGQSPLAGAQLRLETAPARLDCGCGYTGLVGEADVAGHMAVCPACGRVSDLGMPPLELLGLSFASPAVTPAT